MNRAALAVPFLAVVLTACQPVAYGSDDPVSAPGIGGAVPTRQNMVARTAEIQISDRDARAAIPEDDGSAEEPAVQAEIHAEQAARKVAEKAEQSNTEGVTPGAFCAHPGASGRTVTGLAMTCSAKAGDQARWRSNGEPTTTPAPAPPTEQQPRRQVSNPVVTTTTTAETGPWSVRPTSTATATAKAAPDTTTEEQDEAPQQSAGG